jgi:hypothetical protein
MKYQFTNPVQGINSFLANIVRPEHFFDRAGK